MDLLWAFQVGDSNIKRWPLKHWISVHFYKIFLVYFWRNPGTLWSSLHEAHNTNSYSSFRLPRLNFPHWTTLVGWSDLRAPTMQVWGAFESDPPHQNACSSSNYNGRPTALLSNNMKHPPSNQFGWFLNGGSSGKITAGNCTLANQLARFLWGSSEHKLAPDCSICGSWACEEIQLVKFSLVSLICEPLACKVSEIAADGFSGN